MQADPIEVAWKLGRRQQSTLLEFRDGWQKAPYRGKLRASLVCNNLAKAGLLHTRRIRKSYLFCLTPLGCEVQKAIRKGLPPKPRGKRCAYEPTAEQYAILERACEMFGVTPEKVYQRNRTAIMQDVRQAVVIALHRKWPDMPYMAMVRVLGRSDHSMAIYWLEAGHIKYEREEWFREVVAELCGDELPEPAEPRHDKEKLADFWRKKEDGLAEIKALDAAIMAHETRNERAAMEKFSKDLLAAIQSARMAATEELMRQ